MQKNVFCSKTICESSLIQREIVTGQSIQHLHVSESVTFNCHGAELNFLSIHLSGYGGYTLKLNRLFNQLGP